MVEENNVRRTERKEQEVREEGRREEEEGEGSYGRLQEEEDMGEG